MKTVHRESQVNQDHLNNNEDKPQVAVIGAGVIGVCCALALQKKGVNVTLIDKTGVAQGCSKGNAGHFATEQVFPLAEAGLLPQLPKMLLSEDGPISINMGYLPKAIPWFLRFIGNMLPSRFHRHTAALRSLNENAIPAYDRLLQENGLTHFLLKEGSLLTFESTSDKVIQAMQQRFQDNGVTVEWLNNAETKALEPALADSVTSALFFPDVAHTPDPEQLCLALFDKFTSNGGYFLENEVRSLHFSDDVIRVQTQDMRLSFDKVLIATGAWSKQLLTQLGYNVPLDTERGYHMMVDEYPAMTRPVASHERKMIMTPMTAGLRLAGTVEFAGLHAKSNWNRAKMLARHGTKLLTELPAMDQNQLDSQDTKTWMGMRPSLPDSLPVIGQAPRHDKLYFAFGHQHLGLTQGAITGELISDLLTETTPSNAAAHNPSIDLSPFCISRFG